jgi:4-aminobutyrate aminotransferase-like enzyme
MATTIKGKVVKLIPALTSSDEELDEALGTLGEGSAVRNAVTRQVSAFSGCRS